MVSNAVLYRQLEALRLDLVGQIDHFDDRITRTLLALEGFNDARLKVFQAMQKRPLVALEYSTARTKDLPDTSARSPDCGGPVGAPDRCDRKSWPGRFSTREA